MAADGVQRAQLRFPQAVRRHFRFLEAIGFQIIDSTPTLVRFAHGDVEARVYHGRHSYELGFEAGRSPVLYPLSAMIRLSDEARARDYRNYAALSADAVEKGLASLAQIVDEYARCVLVGDAEVYERLRSQQKDWAAEYALDTIANQVRPEAERAFRERRYAVVVDLLEKILPRLTDSERRKLDIARRRARPSR